MPSSPLRLALAQTAPVAADLPANLAAAVDAIRQAAERGAALIAFPELSLTGYELAAIAARPDLWLTVDDLRLEPVRDACAGAGITAVLGAPVRDPDDTPRLGSLIVTPDRRTVRWCKQHLHGAERELFRAGDADAPLAVAGWQVALGICFDAAKPSHAAEAAARGADLYLVSAFYSPGDERRLDLHFGARAMDHRMFSAMAGMVGDSSSGPAIGGSGVWAPSGDAVVRAGAAPTLLIAELDPAQHQQYR